MLCVNTLSLMLSMAATIVGKYVVDWAVTDGKIAKYAIVMGAVTLATIGVGLLSQLVGAYLSERMTMGLTASSFDRVQRVCKRVGCCRRFIRYIVGDLQEVCFRHGNVLRKCPVVTRPKVFIVLA